MAASAKMCILVQIGMSPLKVPYNDHRDIQKILGGDFEDWPNDLLSSDTSLAAYVNEEGYQLGLLRNLGAEKVLAGLGFAMDPGNIVLGSLVILRIDPDTGKATSVTEDQVLAAESAYHT
jgi:hypothetical protein